MNGNFGILHSPVYTFSEKAYIIELNANVVTGNLKLEIRVAVHGLKLDIRNFGEIKRVYELRVQKHEGQI